MLEAYMNSLKKNNGRNSCLFSKLKNEGYKGLPRIPMSPSLTGSLKAPSILVNRSQHLCKPP